MNPLRNHAPILKRPITTTMTDPVIHCPNCQYAIPLTEALSTQLREQMERQLRSDYDARLQQALSDALARKQEELGLEMADLKNRLAEESRRMQETQQRELALRAEKRRLEEQAATQAEQIRSEVEARLKKEEQQRIEAAVAQTEQRIKQQGAGELELLRRQLTEQQAKVQAAQQAELELRKKAGELEQRQREMDLEIARRLDAEKQALEVAIRKTAGEEQALKLREKEKQIEDLRKALDEAKRKSDQGSQELQGEVLELDIQAALVQKFPFDRIEPVPKGVAGADLIHTVHNSLGQPCGKIIWETKNTRNWSGAWIGKLKDDQRATGCNLAILVSAALPDQVREFDSVDGVWVASLRVWPALACALREQLLQVAFAHAANQGKNEKIEAIYRYLAGDQFRQKVQGIVEAFTALQDQLARERRAMEKLWKEREKQIDRVITNTVGMYGEMSGILGASMPEIPALTLEAGLLENEAD